MKPLYLVGTERNVGKTTLALGLAQLLRERGLRVGFTKPVGQRAATAGGKVVHEDARLVGSLLGTSEADQAEMAFPLEPGRVETELQDLDAEKLLQRVEDACTALARTCDVVIIEAMGHVAVGACLKLSSGDIAHRLGARPLLIANGGIGRTIDEVALCGTFLTARGAEVTGVVVNKVWPEKFDRVRQATTQGLGNLGYTSFGTLPFEERLACPTMGQVRDLIGGKVISGEGLMGAHVLDTIVAAMEAGHMVRYLTRSTLVITPGDRSDNLLAALSAHMVAYATGPKISGIVMTGGFEPDSSVMELIRQTDLPVILVEEDTYPVASKIRQAVFKIPLGDSVRIQQAVNLVRAHVDVDALIEPLKE